MKKRTKNNRYNLCTVRAALSGTIWSQMRTFKEFRVIVFCLVSKMIIKVLITLFEKTHHHMMKHSLLLLFNIYLQYTQLIFNPTEKEIIWWLYILKIIIFLNDLMLFSPHWELFKMYIFLISDLIGRIILDQIATSPSSGHYYTLH